jgi:hypothetical protein
MSKPVLLVIALAAIALSLPAAGLARPAGGTLSVTA